MNPLCRVRDAIFRRQGSLADALRALTEDDLRVAPPAVVEQLQRGIGSAFLPGADPRWLQLYLTLLLKGVDIMDTAVVPCPGEQAKVLAVARAAIAARDASPRAPRITEWLTVGALIVMAVFAGAILCIGVIDCFRRQKQR